MIKNDGRRDRQRASSRAYHAKLAESGKRKVTFWITPEGSDALARLAIRQGSQEGAILAAILDADQKVGSQPDTAAGRTP